MPHVDYVPPVGCTVPLPEVTSDSCSPVLELSELIDIYFCEKAGKVFTDVTSPTEWAGRLNDDGTVPVGAPVGTVVADVIRHLPIIGEYAKPALTERDLSGGREKFPARSTHTYTFTVDEINAKNYKLAQFSQSSTREVRAWFKTKGKKMIGGNKGIVGRLRLDPVFAKGAETLVEIQGTLVLFGVGVISPDLHDSAV